MAHKMAVWLFEFISISVLALTTIFLAIHWGSLPSQIPIHFGPTGQANKWGGKHTILLFMLLDFATYVLLSVAARYQKLINLPIKVDRESPVVVRQLKEMVALLKVVETLTFGLIIWASTQTALGRAHGLGQAFLPSVLISNLGIILLYLIVIGNQHRKHP